MPRPLPTLIVISLLTACGAREPIAPDVGGAGGSSVGGSSGGSGGSTGGGAGASGGVGGSSAGGTPAVVPVCGDSCLPPGDGPYVVDVNDIFDALQGRWQYCDDGWLKHEAPADTIGFEFGPASRVPISNGVIEGGDFYYLVPGATEPERGDGVAYHLTYNVSSSLGQINISTTDGAFWVHIRFSQCSTELEFDVFYEPEPSLAVRF